MPRPRKPKPFRTAMPLGGRRPTAALIPLRTFLEPDAARVSWAAALREMIEKEQAKVDGNNRRAAYRKANLFHQTGSTARLFEDQPGDLEAENEPLLRRIAQWQCELDQVLAEA